MNKTQYLIPESPIPYLMIDLEIKQSIADNLDIASLSEYELEEVISQLEKNILKRIHLKVATTLNAEQNARLIDLINDNDDEAVRYFLLLHIPDLYEQIAKIARWTILEFQELKN